MTTNVPAVHLFTHMHMMQVSTAAYPDECTAEHSTHYCTQSTLILYKQGDLMLHKHTQWKTAAVNIDLPAPQDSDYCGTQVPLLPSLLQYPWSYKLLLVCQNSSCSYGLDLCKTPHLLSIKGTNTQHIYPATKDQVIK